LSLLEFLIGTDDPATTAQYVCDWLGQHCGAKQVVVAMRDVESRYLIALAGRGVPPERLAEFSLDVSDHTDPLIDVLSQRDPQFFVRPPKQSRPPLTTSSFHAVPLRSHVDPFAVGLLIVSGEKARIDPLVPWIAEVFGEKLRRARAVLLGNRAGRERTYLYAIINAVTDPILVTDPEGKLLLANARAEKLFSAPDDASEGRRRAVALNNMLFSAALASWAVEATGVARRELPLVDPVDGSDLLFELLSQPGRDGPGTEGETAIVSVLRNVTDLGRAMAEIEENYRRLRDAEAEIRAERHRLELVIDSVADPIVVTKPEGEIVLMNALAEKFFMVPEGAKDEAQRRTRANEAHFSSFVSNLLFSGEEGRYRGEVTLVDPSTGAPMPAEAIAGKILSEQGELTGLVTILHDRTEAIEKAQLYERLKQASEQLERRVQEATAELAQQNELLRRQALELEQASALKSQFLANVSHEFRTPLNAILGYTFMLLQGVHGHAPPPQKKSLTRIDSNAKHLLALINDILDISRIEAGRMPIHVDRFQLPELIQEVVAELEPLITRSRLPLSTHLARGLPPIRSDRQKVKQIVLNLLTNALKFTPQGSVKIDVIHDRRAARVLIGVHDTGVGIPEAEQDKVFEDFRQAKSWTNAPAPAGTGLGLSICRRLASLLGGQITLKSQVSVGSRFTLVLPVKPPQSAATPRRRAS
jgi:PAS domain S-box-containing protein